MSQPIHKQKHNSCLKDPMDFPHGTTKCGLILEWDEMVYHWKDVTCKECLEEFGEKDK